MTGAPERVWVADVTPDGAVWRKAFDVKPEFFGGSYSAYIPEYLHTAVVAERDALRAEVERLTNAAQAVLDRWDSPSWIDAGPTAAVMADLRAALGDSKP